MKVEKLTEHLISGIAILKAIRVQNEEQNKTIDAFLEALTKDLQQEQTEDEKKADSKKTEEDKAKEAAVAKSVADLAKAIEAMKKAEEQAKKEADAKIDAKKKALEEAVEDHKRKELEKELDEDGKPYELAEGSYHEGEVGEGGEEGEIAGEVGVEDGSTSTGTPTKGVRKRPQKVVIEKHAPIVPQEEVGASADGEAPGGPFEVEDRSKAGKVWCSVCEEYHDEGSEVK